MTHSKDWCNRQERLMTCDVSYLEPEWVVFESQLEWFPISLPQTSRTCHPRHIVRMFIFTGLGTASAHFDIGDIRVNFTGPQKDPPPPGHPQIRASYALASRPEGPDTLSEILSYSRSRKDILRRHPSMPWRPTADQPSPASAARSRSSGTFSRPMLRESLFRVDRACLAYIQLLLLFLLLDRDLTPLSNFCVQAERARLGVQPTIEAPALLLPPLTFGMNTFRDLHPGDLRRILAALVGRGRHHAFSSPGCAAPAP